jgi:hypothetical protein
MEFSELNLVDECILTCEQIDIDWEKPASDLLGISKDDGEACWDNEDTETEGKGMDTLTHSQALELVNQIKNYTVDQGYCGILEHVVSIEEGMSKITMKKGRPSELLTFSL